MSALGHKRTFAVQNGHVRFGREKQNVQGTRRCLLCAKSGHPALDQLIGASEYLARQGQAERLAVFRLIRSSNLVG